MDESLSPSNDPPPQKPDHEYLTTEEAAKLMRRKVQTVRNRMTDGTLKLGKHYFKPNGGHPLFKRSAIIDFIEGEL